MQGFHALDFDNIRTSAKHLRAHGAEEIGEVNHVRLLRRVFNDRLARHQYRRNHNIDGCADAGHVQIDTAALQALRAGLGGDIIAGGDHFRAQRGKALHVLIHRTGGKVAAAGHRHMAFPKTAKLRAHQIVGGADFSHQRGIGFAVLGVGAVNFYGRVISISNVSAHLLQNLKQKPHIGNIRDIFNQAGAFYQKGGWNNRDCGVFRAADCNRTFQRAAAGNFISQHVRTRSKWRSAWRFPKNGRTNPRPKYTIAQNLLSVKNIYEILA